MIVRNAVTQRISPKQHSVTTHPLHSQQNQLNQQKQQQHQHQHQYRKDPCVFAMSSSAGDVLAIREHLPLETGATTAQPVFRRRKSLPEELWMSTDLLFQNKLTWLLVLGPIAIVGDFLGVLGEATCFCFSGIALIPCAERLSFITEQVAEHTNGTIGALLNATFGNAPELLIAVAALRSGFYRVVQLAMLGSMVTNMILIFGLSCLIGGLRWQVQDLRLVSGNVSVGMLLVSTAGSLIPATLILSGQFPSNSGSTQTTTTTNTSIDTDVPTQEEITLSRVNAAVMFLLYICYLIFQLGTHKEEFDEEEHRIAQPNVFCRALFSSASRTVYREVPVASSTMDESISHASYKNIMRIGHHPRASEDLSSVADEENALVEQMLMHSDSSFADFDTSGRSMEQRRRRQHHQRSHSSRNLMDKKMTLPGKSDFVKTKNSDAYFDSDDDNDADDDSSHEHVHNGVTRLRHSGPMLSMRCGIVWLFLITLCISAMSDILVDTIDGFAKHMQLSQVFTSMVIVPFFSNIAEQVSAFLFAYRGEMDLCVGVTIGSAIQIATFVLPGSVLIGLVMDKPMTLYFHSYETVCLFLCTVIVAVVLQGGTTNWFVGIMLVGIYIMFAAGIWFHEVENISFDVEDLLAVGGDR